MVQTVANLGVVWHGSSYVGSFLPLNSECCPNLWLRDLGCHPAHQAVSGGIPPQVDAEDIGETEMSLGGRYLGITPLKEDICEVCLEGGGDIHLQATEYRRTIHCDATYYGPLLGGKAEARIMGPQEVVGSGKNRFSGSEIGR